MTPMTRWTTRMLKATSRMRERERGVEAPPRRLPSRHQGVSWLSLSLMRPRMRAIKYKLYGPPYLGTLRRHRRSSSGVFSRGGDELSLLSVRGQITRSSQRKKNALTPFSGTITNKARSNSYHEPSTCTYDVCNFHASSLSKSSPVGLSPPSVHAGG